MPFGAASRPPSRAGSTAPAQTLMASVGGTIRAVTRRPTPQRSAPLTASEGSPSIAWGGASSARICRRGGPASRTRVGALLARGFGVRSSLACLGVLSGNDAPYAGRLVSSRACPRRIGTTSCKGLRTTPERRRVGPTMRVVTAQV